MSDKEIAKDTKFIASKETAKNEIKKMLDYYEIDIEEIEDKKVKDAIKASYERLVKAVRRGRLEIKMESGQINIIQRTRPDENGKSKTIEYREIDGTAKCEADNYPADAYYQRAYAVMGSLSGMGEIAIKKLKSVDLSLVEVLGLIFLSV